MDKKITYLTFLFHFNQNLTTYAAVANEICYKGLLEVLLSHPRLKFMIHISGTLINALNWLDDKAIQLIDKGIKNGQFELVGSTYSQNIMYSTNNSDNTSQIQLHKKLLKDIFNVEPVSFWNPERCFRQDLEKLILDNGYKYTWIEDHILKDSGAKETDDYILLKDGLGVFNDRKDYLKQANQAIFKGDFDKCFEFMDSQKGRLLNYAEDAEAMGLWQFEGHEEGFPAGTDPRKILQNLDAFLTRIEKTEGLQVTTLSEYAKNKNPESTLDVIKDGQAKWMVKAIKDTKARYHEDGFTDWFDFNQRSMDLIYFRHLYNKVRNLIKLLDYQLKNEAAESKKSTLTKFMHHLKLLFAIHQYEFGCIGVVRIGDMQWEGVKNAFLVAYIAQIALLNPKRGSLIQDIDLDGLPEIFFISDKQVFVFSPIGGRLISWFDMETGCELVGNECSSFYGEQFSYYLPSLFIKVPKLETDGIVYENRRFCVKKRALNDILDINCASPKDIEDPRKILQEVVQGKIKTSDINSKLAIPLDAKYRYLFQQDNILFSYSTPEIKLTKTINAIIGGINVKYELENISTADYELDFHIQNELIPDYINVLTNGRKVLKTGNNGNKYFISNTSSSIGIEIEALNGIDQVKMRDNFTGIEINPYSKILLAKGSKSIVEFNMIRKYID